MLNALCVPESGAFFTILPLISVMMTLSLCAGATAKVMFSTPLVGFGEILNDVFLFMPATDTGALVNVS